MGCCRGGRGVAALVSRSAARPLCAGTDTSVSGLTAASMPETGFVMWSMSTILGHSARCLGSVSAMGHIRISHPVQDGLSRTGAQPCVLLELG